MVGACGTIAALNALVDALCSGTNESSRRAGSHGLGSAGDAAVPFLLEVLSAEDHSPLVLGCAVDALGEAAMTPNMAVIKRLSAVCFAQHEAILAATRKDQLPEFEAGVRPFLSCHCLTFAAKAWLEPENDRMITMAVPKLDALYREWSAT